MTNRQSLILYALACCVALEFLVASLIFVISQRNAREQVKTLFYATPTPTETPTLTAQPPTTPTFTRPSITTTSTLLPRSPTMTAPVVTSPTKPGAKPLPQSSAAPRTTPTVRASPTPIATSTSTLVIQSEGAAVRFVSVVGGPPGGSGSVVVQAAPKANCSILYILPVGKKSDASGLTNKEADSAGRVAWSWANEPETKRGVGIVVVTCDGSTATAQMRVQ